MQRDRRGVEELVTLLVDVEEGVILADQGLDRGGMVRERMQSL